MLTLEIEEQEIIDESDFSIYQIPHQILKLEHSLISISRWESKWQVPFLHTKKSVAQSIDYVRCMTTNPNVNPIVYHAITSDDIKLVNNYIHSPMSATTFNDGNMPKGNRNGELITSETIYYYMVTFQIPSEYEKWHLNRLMNLIKICEIKSEKPKKMKNSEILRQNTELNRIRRARLGTKG